MTGREANARSVHPASAGVPRLPGEIARSPNFVGIASWPGAIGGNLNTDHDLLGTYATTRSELAFAGLVERYVALVYSAALRQLGGDAHLAQDVTQGVFIDLARKAGQLPPTTVLAAWLYTSTRFAAAN